MSIDTVSFLGVSVVSKQKDMVSVSRTLSSKPYSVKNTHISGEFEWNLHSC